MASVPSEIKRVGICPGQGAVQEAFLSLQTLLRVHSSLTQKLGRPGALLMFAGVPTGQAEQVPCGNFRPQIGV